jgi:hypothetical protein
MIIGIEYDWLASDRVGHVAIFTTAGGSYGPGEFLRDTDQHDRAIDEVLATPPSTVALFAPGLQENLNTIWRDLAERGLFGFDGDPNGGPYEKVAAPAQPVRVDELPSGAASVVRELVFPNLDFSTLVRVTEEALGK